jgi:hypothetical protein
MLGFVIRSRLNLRSAFFAFEGAARTLYDTAHGYGLLAAAQSGFFLPRGFQFIVKRDDIGQKTPLFARVRAGAGRSLAGFCI